MATAIYASNLTTVFLFESTTGVSAFGGGGAGLTAEIDLAMEGTNAVDKQITASADKGFMHDAGTDYVISAKDHFYIWIYSAIFGINDIRDNNGIYAAMGDSTSAFVKFHVDGIDTLPLGGAKVYPIRFVETALSNFRTLVGTPTATPQTIGGGLKVTGDSKDVNLGVDGARKGSGYLVTLGTGADPEANLAGIAADDESTSEGILQTAAGGFNLQGKIRIGNGATECEFLDSNQNIFLLDTIHSLTDFTEILIAHEDSILTLTNINFIALGTNNPGRFEVLTPIIDAQDETSYDNSPTTEGTFVAGTGYSVADVITMSDNTRITVDTLSGSAVATFTVDSSEAYSSLNGVANTQVSVLPAGGSGFTLTPDTDNLRTTPTLICAGLAFIDFGETVLDSGATLLICRWIGSGAVINNGATLNGSSILTSTVAAGEGALVFNETTDPDGELDGMAFSQGAAAHSAIEFGTAVTSDITLRDIDFTGFGSTDDVNGAVFKFLAITGSLSLNLIGCTTDGTFSVDDTAGIVVTVVEDPVTLTVNTVDNTGAAVGSAAVLVTAADNSGPLPHEELVTITRSGSTATVAHTGHGIATGKKVEISGCLEPEYNGVHTTTLIDANSYSYTVSGTPTTPATPRRLVQAQDETFYNNSPTTEGTFSGGTGHAINDVLTLDKGITVTVDNVAGGVVTEFTIEITDSLNGITTSTTLNQLNSDGAGIDFSLSPDTDNINITATAVIISGTSNGSGVITDGRTYGSNQPISGYSRKASAQPFYTDGAISGTISSTDGLTTNAVMTSDE